MAKAKRFMEVAEVARSADYYDSVVSLAVSAGINYSDALCLISLGRYSSGGSHEDIFALLRKCSGAGDSVARHLRPLLRVKSKAQYSINVCSAKEADDTLRHAERIGTIVVGLVGEGSPA